MQQAVYQQDTMHMLTVNQALRLRKIINHLKVKKKYAAKILCDKHMLLKWLKLTINKAVKDLFLL